MRFDFAPDALGLHALRYWGHGEGETIDPSDTGCWPDGDNPDSCFYDIGSIARHAPGTRSNRT